jgi:hypothetical protein
MPLSFYTDFGEYTTGVQPADWSTRWLATNSTWQVVAKTPSTSGQVLQHTATVTARRALIWDDVGLPTDCDIKTRLKTDTEATLQNGIGLRVSGVAQFVESGYFIQLASRAQLGYDILFGKYVAGAFTELGNSGQTFDWSTAQYVFLRLQAIGTTIKGKYWFDGATEPASFQFSVTDASLTSGGVGVIANTLTGTRDYAQFWADIIPKDIAGVTNAVTTISGSQQVDRKLFALTDGVSSINAVPQVSRLLTGLIDGTSDVDALLGLNFILAGTTQASSSIAAAIKLLMDIIASTEGSSQLTGTIIIDWNLNANVESQSLITVAAKVARLLMGLIEAESSVTGNAFEYRAIQLTGSAITIININANTDTTIELDGRF